MGSSVVLGAVPELPPSSLRTSRFGRALQLAAAVAFAAPLAGSCSPSSPTGTASPTPGPNTVALGSLSPAVTQFYLIPINTGSTGILSLTVNWTVATDTILAGIATSSCTTSLYLASGCVFLAVDGTTDATATKLVTAAGVTPGRYILVIQNQGPADEIVTYSLNLTPS